MLTMPYESMMALSLLPSSKQSDSR